MFDDIFGDILDDITKKPAAPPEPEKDEWDTGNGAWDTGQRENLWRSGQQFWDTGSPRPGFGPASIPDPSADIDYDPEPDEEEFFDEEEEEDRW